VNLADLTSEMLRRAIGLYAQEAFGDDWPETVQRAARIRGRAYHQLLRRMTDESRMSEDSHHRRYVLRLGNRNYPCMKLVLEEILFDGEFFFLVDTHDELDLDPSFPGYDDWVELRKYNRELKRRIESRWADEGLPTVVEARDLAAEDAERCQEPSRGRRLILALDDPVEIEAVALALRGHGYEVVEAHDPDAVVGEAANENCDLALLGHVLGGRSGRKLAATLSEQRRERECRRPLRIVLGAPRWDARGRPDGVDAVVPEPFDRSELLGVLDDLLQ